MAGKGKQTLTLTQLRDLAKELRERAGIFDTVVRKVEKTGEKEVEAMGYPMAVRGLAHIDALVRSCKKEAGIL